MAWTIKKFLPKLGVKKKAVAIPLTENPQVFSMKWTRGPLLKEKDSAEQYWLSSQQLPTYSLSGPLPYHARKMAIALPAPAIETRQFPTNTVNANGILNGQVYSQPLYDGDAGGFTREYANQMHRPFQNTIFGDPIQPAGAA